MNEPTDEMRQVAYALLPTTGKGHVDVALAAVLAIVERDQAAELADLRALFELQWTRSREADARWRAEDPEARANVWPDLGVLLKWLMDSADRAYGRGRDDEAAGLPLPEYPATELSGAERRCPVCDSPDPNCIHRQDGTAAEPHCGEPVGEHMLCARPRGHGFPPCGIPDPGGCGGELAS